MSLTVVSLLGTSDDSSSSNDTSAGDSCPCMSMAFSGLWLVWEQINIWSLSADNWADPLDLSWALACTFGRWNRSCLGVRLVSALRFRADSSTTAAAAAAAVK
ncbi:hypothetical protein E2C01_009711 [Portunus trituberculatus]|uniref:Uncharacterized protein n=1 Tax=Portunus trituberculatus TaxID=210409 RepID=A0A5B7D6I3_PORTR|nr:hypothetical protein [Portunus trituberculatus]